MRELIEIKAMANTKKNVDCETTTPPPNQLVVLPFVFIFIVISPNKRLHYRLVDEEKMKETISQY